MNETLQTIAARYSCRDFADTPPTGEQLQALVKAALAAPSAMNLQPWHVIIVTDKALIDEMDADAMDHLAANDKGTYERFMERGGKLFYNAPCMVVVTSDGSGCAAGDCCILSQNVALAAHSLGLGNVLCGMAGVPFNGPRGAEWKKRLKFPDGHGFGMAVLAGTANSGKKPHELNMDKVTFIGDGT
jgi:nitroreductase